MSNEIQTGPEISSHRVVGERVYSESYPDPRTKIPRKHHSVVMDIPKGKDPSNLVYSQLQYREKPVTEGHWRDYPDNPTPVDSSVEYGPHVYQLRGRWVALHRRCLRNPSDFSAKVSTCLKKREPVSNL